MKKKYDEFQLRMVNMSNIVALDVDLASGRVFWADTRNNKIYSGNVSNPLNYSVVSYNIYGFALAYLKGSITAKLTRIKAVLFAFL